MAEQETFLTDGSPLITAAEMGKLRLVRLLVEGGAQVNERNQRGETPLLAACRALSADQSGNTTSLRIIRYLLQNHADPNAQDEAGRTPLMYACMGRAGVEVTTALTSAGADPSIEDHDGASALVYAINARNQDTVEALLDTCRAKGRDIIIIATDPSTDGATVSRRYLNVPSSPDTSPVVCMSPSDIELKTNSPNSETEAEGIFNFRASSKRESMAALQLSSEPWLSIHNLAHLSYTSEESIRRVGEQEKEKEQVTPASCGILARYADTSSSKKASSGRTARRTHAENPARASQERVHSRRNTLPSLAGQTLLEPPTISLSLSSSDTRLHDKFRTRLLPPVPTSRHVHLSSNTSSLSLASQFECNTMRKWRPQEQLLSKPQLCSAGLLPPLSVKSSARTSPHFCSGEARPILRAKET